MKSTCNQRGDLAMTEKHFEALANALYRARQVTLVEMTHTPERKRQWEVCRNLIANACHDMNPHFDFERFTHRATYGHNLAQGCCK
jgi:hypothetical protein